MKRRVYFCVFCVLLWDSHVQGQSFAVNNSPIEFRLRIGNDDAGKGWVRDHQIYGSDCEVAVRRIGGKDALEISTSTEFCDAFLDCQKLFGRSLDLTQARYLSMRVYRPSGSWICALKLNFRDADRNFGGVPEFVN